MLRGYNTALQKKTWGGAGAPGLEHKSAVHTDKVNHILVYMSKHGASRTKEVYTENRKKKKKVCSALQTSSGVPCPALSFPLQGRHSHNAVSPAVGH